MKAKAKGQRKLGYIGLDSLEKANNEASKKPIAPRYKAGVGITQAGTVIAPPQTGASKAGWHKIMAKYKCDKRYQLQELWGVRVPSTTTPDALGVGALFHAGRAHWFLSGFPTGADYEAKLFAYMEDAALRMSPPVREEAITRAKSYVAQYAAYWGGRAKPTVVGVEYDINAPLMGPGFDDRTARVDDVSYYPELSLERLAIGECKTTSVSVADVVNEYTLNGQILLQRILWEASANGRAKHGPVDEVMLDVIVKGYGKEKCTFGRVPLRIPDFALRWFGQSLLRHVHEAATMTTATLVDRRITSCTETIGRMRVPCPYRDLCLRGKSAATMYVGPKGQSLATMEFESEARPWD